MQKDTTTKSAKRRIQELNPQTISNQMRAKARISLHEIMGENDLGRIFFDYFKTMERVLLFELNSNK